MDKWGALQRFWSSFGLTAYDETTVPDDAALPYITYEARTADLDEEVALTASLWYRGNTWAEISQKAEFISNSIGGGTGVRYDNGRLWVTKESPFAQRMSEPSDANIRRIVLMVSAEFQ
jgi:hypothetical protein